MRVVFAAVLYRLSSAATYQRCQDKYGISRSLLYEYETSILEGLEAWLAPLISFPQGQEAVIGEAADWSDIDPQFINCVGAADGTLVPFTPRGESCFSGDHVVGGVCCPCNVYANPLSTGLPPDEARTWICRKSFSAMNVLLCIKHDRTFSFVASGFEGQCVRCMFAFACTIYRSTWSYAQRRIAMYCFCVAGACHDSYMVEQSGLLSALPSNKFVLFDAGGPLENGKMLTPYRSTRCTELLNQIVSLALLYHPLLSFMHHITLCTCSPRYKVSC